MKLSLVAAIGKNGSLGFGNKLPWYLPDDLRRFRALTKGHTVIMGRKTFESIGKSLPERKNIVITRNTDYKADGCFVEASFEKALKDSKDEEEIFVIGGGEIYSLALPYADRMYLTFVDADTPKDTSFPKFDESDWRVIKEEAHGKDEKHPYSFIFKIYERRGRGRTPARSL